MIIAKVTVDGETFDIVSKSDLLRLQDAIGADFSKNLHSLREYDVTIHPMLKKFNALDYLFSQEFLLSSVGTHSNHPSKAKIKPTIIWTD
jgi:hypothetical protein